MPDQLTISQGTVLLETEEGNKLERPESQLLDMLRRDFQPPWAGQALPDGVKLYEWRPPFLVVVHQTPPHVRQLRWIAADSPAPYGEKVVYRKVRLSIPYAITFAVYVQQSDRLMLTQANELYFRNEPLRRREDRLGYPALLNLSRIHHGGREKSWICTQYLQPRPEQDWTLQLQRLLEHTWNGGFNLSSENHEGASWFGLSQGIHPELHPVERWQEASAANDAFALTVPWKPVTPNVGQIVESILAEVRPSGGGSRLLRPPGSSSLVKRFLNYAQAQGEK